MMNIQELVVYVCRFTGWTAERVLEMPVAELYPFIEELHYQVEMEDYRAQARAAMVAATVANCLSKRRYKAEDFIGPPPQRKKVEGFEFMETPHTIKLSDGKEYNVKKINLRIIRAFEQKFKQSFSKTMADPWAEHIIYLLHLCLVEEYPHLTEEKIAELADLETLNGFGKVVK